MALLLAACNSLPGGFDLPPKGEMPPMQEYQIDTELVNESSGLARSHREAELLWTHNDSGGKTQAYAFDTQGHYQGTLSVQPALNLDWEDMTSFVEDGQPKLLLADIGDNGAFRPFLTIYIVDEPQLEGLPRPFDLKALPLRQMQVTYPDGPRDAESIAVDADEGSIYIISKRDLHPKLYRLPLKPAVPVAIAQDLGEINIPRAPEGADGPERINWVTSMDIDDSATRLTALTLTKAYIYAREPGESWQAALAREPQAVTLPPYPQIEAVAFSPDGEALYITSEGLPALFAVLQIPAVH